MAIRDVFKLTRKTFINPAGWFGLDGFIKESKATWGIIGSLFKTPRPTLEETFGAAQKRLKLTDADVKSMAKNYRLYAWVFVGCGVLSFAYAFYLLFRYFTLAGWLLGMAVTAFFFAQAFRFDFWSFQMRERQLGLTFKQWKDQFLGTEQPK